MTTNTSGIHPAGHRLLVLPDDITETDETLKRAKESQIVIVSDKQMEREQNSQCEGTLIECGPSAWADTFHGELQAHPGDRILMGKYVGIGVQGADGKTYRLIHDIDMVATLEVLE